MYEYSVFDYIPLWSGKVQVPSNSVITIANRTKRKNVYGTVHWYTLCYFGCVSTEHSPWIMWDLKWRRALLKGCVYWIVHSFTFSVFCELHKNFATVIPLDTPSYFRWRLMENTSHELSETKVSILRELLYQIKRHTDGSYSIIFQDIRFWVDEFYWRERWRGGVWNMKTLFHSCILFR